MDLRTTGCGTYSIAHKTKVLCLIIVLIEMEYGSDEFLNHYMKDLTKSLDYPQIHIVLTLLH